MPCYARPVGKPVVVAVLVYAAGPGPGGPSPRAAPAPGPRAALVASLRDRATVVEHAVDAALEVRRQGWRTLDELSFLARGKAALELGRRARERVELEESERQLALAETHFTGGFDEPGVASLAAEAALEHGVTLGELGRTDEARAAFVRALSWWPPSMLTEKMARPDVVRVFHEAEKAPREPFVPKPANDASVTAIAQLRDRPTQSALEALRGALDLDAVIVVASSSDGTKLLAARVEGGCASLPRAVDAASIDRVLDDPCTAHPLALSTDDPRLAVPAPALYAIAKPRAVPKLRSKWFPWVVAGASAVGLAVIGVSIGFAVSDPRYKVHVSF